MTSTTVVHQPLFYAADECWSREQGLPEQWRIENQVLQHQQAKEQARVLCITIMRDYLKDFWRHEVEKAEGEARLWQAITNNRNWWWASVSEKTQIVQHESAKNPIKTRWQQMAENLFAVLLKLDRFDPESDKHISMLARIVPQVERVQDNLLLSIIKFYFSIVQ